MLGRRTWLDDCVDVGVCVPLAVSVCVSDGLRVWEAVCVPLGDDVGLRVPVGLALCVEDGVSVLLAVRLCVTDALCVGDGV